MGAPSHRPVEDRLARAQRWEEGVRAHLGTVEPEWWLRMICGQVVEEIEPHRGWEIRRLARHAREHLHRRQPPVRAFRTSWVELLTRSDLPNEVGW